MIIIEKLFLTLFADITICCNFVLTGKIFFAINQLMQPITHIHAVLWFQLYVNNLTFFLAISGIILFSIFLIKKYKNVNHN